MPTSPSDQEEEKKHAELMKVIEGMVAHAGLAPAMYMPALSKDLKSNPDPVRALKNYHRFLTSGFSDSLLYDFANHRVLQTLFLEIAGQSQYLADILVRNPELLRWLTATNELTKTKTRQEFFREAKAAIGPFERIETKLNALKRFHRREILRLGVREILSEAKVHTITQELSSLADAIIETVLQNSIEELTQHTGFAFPNALAVIALGKLGGEELNFSSDIDLMFVYEKEGKLKAPAERMSSLHEYYVRFSELIVRHLIEQTAEGYFYRVDMRLRPYGKSGLLAMSRAAYRSYYETHGEIWERQMLLKARVIAGNKSVGTRWLVDLKPFIFPKSLARSPVEEIASIKQKIEKRVEGEENIKLGVGGIRDIEFVVQALELLNGGNNPALMQNNSLRALEVLGRVGLLSKEEKMDLDVAYRFLRKVEHRLQLLHGLQTHSLPEISSELLSLAKRLGYPSTDKFIQELDLHRSRVRRIFHSVFSPEIHHKKKKNRVTRGKSDEKNVFDLKHVGFRNLDVARQNMEIARNAFPRLLEQSTLRAFLQALKKFRAPDWGLQNFILLATSESIQRTFAVAFSNLKVIELIVCITSRSQRMTMLLVKEPLLFESLVSQPDEIISGTMQWNFLLDSDPIRFKLFSQFTFVLQWFLRELSTLEVTVCLSEIAEKYLKHTADDVASEMFENVTHFPIAILAMGKLGGREMSLDSDLDLVFIFSAECSGTKNTEVQSHAEDFARAVLKRIISKNEKVYEVDVRLRPEGKNAPLTSDIDYLYSYLKNRALLWERQALIRARVVWGDAKLSEKIYALLQDVVYVYPLPSHWRNEMQLMRQRIEEERGKSRKGIIDLKTCAGGLLDVEFVVQALQLSIGRSEAHVRTQNTSEAIESLREHKALKISEAKKLAFNYERLRCLELLLNMNSEEKYFAWPQSESLVHVVAAGMEMLRAIDLTKSIRTIQKQNQALFLKLMSEKNGQ